MKSDAKNENPISVLLRGAWGVFGYVGLFSFFINLLMLVSPIYMMQIYDRVLVSQNVPTLLFLTLAAVGLILTGALLEYVRSLILIRLSGRLDTRVNNILFSQLLRQSLATRKSGQAQSLRDMDTVRNFLSGSGLIVFFDTPWVPIFIAVIFMMHWTLGALALGGAIVLFLLALLSEFLTREPLKTATGHSITATNFAESSMRNAEVIEAMGMLPGIRTRWLKQHEKSLMLQAVASDKAAFVKSMVKFVRPCLQVGILGLGAYLAISQIITPGVMIAASIIMGRALAPVEMAVGNWRGFIVARGAYDRLKKFVDGWEEKDPMPLPRPTGVLSVEQVVGVPPGTKTPVIKRVSFALKPGESLGLIGPSGAGKSTLARLLVGVWKPASGHVRLDGADIATWDHVELGPSLGYLPQDVELFEGTIAENIARFGAPDPEAVIAAAQLSGVDDMIRRLPESYDTQIGEGGAVLSAGQRQRVGLARAVYKNPVFIVLDEPNSNLDGMGEQSLRQTIGKLKKMGTTVILIAHRPSIISAVDKLLVLKDGMVEDFGPVKEVLPRVTGKGNAAPKSGDESVTANMRPEAKAPDQAALPGAPQRPMVEAPQGGATAPQRDVKADRDEHPPAPSNSLPEPKRQPTRSPKAKPPTGVFDLAGDAPSPTVMMPQSESGPDAAAASKDKAPQSDPKGLPARVAKMAAAAPKPPKAPPPDAQQAESVKSSPSETEAQKQAGLFPASESASPQKKQEPPAHTAQEPSRPAQPPEPAAERTHTPAPAQSKDANGSGESGSEAPPRRLNPMMPRRKPAEEESAPSVEKKQSENLTLI